MLPGKKQRSTETKMLGNDRVLKLTQRNPNSSPGLIGREVFKGANELHAMYNTDTGLWYFKLDRGDVPEALRQHFTSFSHAFKHAKTYFEGKKIDIAEEYIAQSAAS